jgi:hypothetical protein
MTPLTCAECRERLPEYGAGSLADHQSIKRHLSDCAECRREAALWCEVSSAFAAEDTSIPPDTSAATWTAVRARVHAPAQVRAESGRMAPTRSTKLDHIGASVAGDTNPVRLEERPTPRWRSYAAVAAVLLIALLSVAIFGVINRHGRATMVTAPKTCAPSQLKATLPPHASIADISMVAATDGWAVGQIYDPQQDVTPPQTLLLRFQNCAWAPTGDAIPTAQLYKVAMVSATEGLAVGATTKRQAISEDLKGHFIYDWEADQPFLLHYSGAQWRRVELPGVQRIVGVPALRMVSSDEGWLLLDHGGVHTDPYTKAYSFTLLHYQHGTWTPVPLSFKEPTTVLWDLVATATDDCWIVGYGTAASDGGGLIAHYSGGSWQKWNGTIGGVRTYTYYTVAMTSPHDVWAVGNPILHFDGSAWTPGIQAPAQSQGLGDSMSATMISPSEGWAFFYSGPLPNRGNELPVLHYTDGQWQEQHITVVSPVHIESLSNLSMASPTLGWAIGAISIPTSYGATARGVLVYYDNGAWTVPPGQVS